MSDGELMNCKEAQKYIPVFIEDELNYKELDGFMNHIKNCPECMEEMSVQFMVTQGMKRLEDGGPLELNDDLKNLLADSKTVLKRHKLFWRVLLGCEITAFAAMGLIFLHYFFNR